MTAGRKNVVIQRTVAYIEQILCKKEHSALQQCQVSARRGYKIALDNINATTRAIEKVSASLTQCLEEYGEGHNIEAYVLKDYLRERLKCEFRLNHTLKWHLYC